MNNIKTSEMKIQPNFLMVEENLLDQRTYPLIRLSGNYAGKAYFLNDSYNWVIKRDNDNELVLIPEPKN